MVDSQNPRIVITARTKEELDKMKLNILKRDRYRADVTYNEIIVKLIKEGQMGKPQ